MAELGFIRGQNGLVPDGADAAEWFERVKPGARVVAKVAIPRNYKFHRILVAISTSCGYCKTCISGERNV